MFNTDFLLKVIDKENTTRFISKLLFLSLLVVIDFFTLFIFGNLIGIFLYLAILGLIILIGVTSSIKEIKREIINLEKSNSIGIYPEKQFYRLTGLYLAVLLIVLPGLLTTLIGLLLIIPKFRFSIGRILSKSLKLDWNAVYEYKEIYSS